MKRIICYLCGLALLSGCDTLASQKCYLYGTGWLRQGNYSEAICCLKQAARLDPSISCYHHQLASAYYLSGDIDAAWYYSRQAVRCRPCFPEAVVLFNEILGRYCGENHIDLLKMRCSDILRILGDPDEIHIEGCMTTYVYGISTFEFDRDIYIRTFNW